MPVAYELFGNVKKQPAQFPHIASPVPVLKGVLFVLSAFRPLIVSTYTQCKRISPIKCFYPEPAWASRCRAQLRPPSLTTKNVLSMSDHVLIGKGKIMRWLAGDLSGFCSA